LFVGKLGFLEASSPIWLRERFLTKKSWRSYDHLFPALKMERENIIDMIDRADLRGRGGAGFKTALKWRLAAEQADPVKYLVINAEEGEPGTFKDRVLMERDPEGLLEGMLLAGYAINASEGIIYLRGEYEEVKKKLEKAINEAVRNGYLGENILGSGWSFKISIHSSEGDYITGEESALLNALEGKRHEPRLKPPFPVQAGYLGRPTVVNNVETIYNIPLIMELGPKLYANIGPEGNAGTYLFSISGFVKREGVAEAHLGATLKDLLGDFSRSAGLFPKMKLVQIGGAAGSCVPVNSEWLNLPLLSFKEKGLSIGTGAIRVMNKEGCVVDWVRQQMAFFMTESCGKCTPCRIGTVRLWELLNQFSEGKGNEKAYSELKELANDVKSMSLCGLGQAAPTAILTSVKYFPEEYYRHFQSHCSVCQASLNKEIRSGKPLGSVRGGVSFV